MKHLIVNKESKNLFWNDQYNTWVYGSTSASVYDDEDKEQMQLPILGEWMEGEHLLLRRAALRVINALESNLEMGNHHMNNHASAEFARVYPILSRAIGELRETVTELDID